MLPGAKVPSQVLGMAVFPTQRRHCPIGWWPRHGAPGCRGRSRLRGAKARRPAQRQCEAITWTSVNLILYLVVELSIPY